MTRPLGGSAVGNCGRPLDQICGLIDPNECATHGFGLSQNAAAMNARAEAALAGTLAKLRRESDAYSRRMIASLFERRIAATTPDDLDSIKRELFRLKVKAATADGKDPRIVTYLAQHRFRGGW